MSESRRQNPSRDSKGAGLTFPPIAVAARLKPDVKIDTQAWDVMVAHAEAKFPNECCVQ